MSIVAKKKYLCRIDDESKNGKASGKGKKGVRLAWTTTLRQVLQKLEK
jgi:hypothetical protein